MESKLKQLESKQPIMGINTLRLSEVKQNMIKEYAFRK